MKYKETNKGRRLLCKRLKGIHEERLVGNPEREPYRGLTSKGYISYMGASSRAFVGGPNTTGRHHYALTEKGLEVLFPNN